MHDMYLTAVVILLMITLPGIWNAPECSKNWAFDKIGGKYIKFMVRPLTWAAARTACEKVGGQLLVVDEATQRFVTKSQKTDVDYWIGLKSSRNNQMVWVDGTILNKTDFENFRDKNMSGEGCFASPFSENSFWVFNHCQWSKGYICEAAVPCASRPVLRINNGQRYERGNVTFYEEKTVNIKCFLRGSPSEVIGVSLSCDWDVEGVHPKSKTATKRYCIDWTRNWKRCECKSTLTHNRVEQSHVTIHFKSRPLIISEEKVNSTYYTATVRKERVIHLDIYANPEVISYILTKDGVDIKNPWQIDYTIVLKPLDRPFTHRVKIKLTPYSVMQGGEYVMIIDNGMAEKLKYTFTLTVKERIVPPIRANNKGIYITTITLLSVAAVAVIGIVLIKEFMTSRNSVPIKDTGQEESESASSCTSHESVPS